MAEPVVLLVSKDEASDLDVCSRVTSGTQLAQQLKEFVVVASSKAISKCGAQSAPATRCKHDSEAQSRHLQRGRHRHSGAVQQHRVTSPERVRYSPTQWDNHPSYTCSLRLLFSAADAHSRSENNKHAYAVTSLGKLDLGQLASATHLQLILLVTLCGSLRGS